MRRLSYTLNLALVTVLAWVLLGLPGAHGATLQYVNLPAPTFVGVPKSVHNNGNAPDACPAQVPLVQGDENYGDLNAAKGSFLSFMRLPSGATVKSLSVFGNDFDSMVDFHAYLVRKLIADGTTPKQTGYKVMATASSSGAVNDTIREFTDTTVTAASVDDSKYMYYVELVVCSDTVEPFMVQVVYQQ